MKPTFLIAGLVAATLAACGGDDPVEAAGTYIISLTNRDNGCMAENWVVGESTAGIGVVMTQNGAALRADVQPGGGRLALDLLLGDHIFTGEVDGNHLDLLIEGTPSFSQGTCDYTFDAQIDADLDGDVLSGRIHYRAQTDGSTECGALTGCDSFQELLGNRPPS